MPLGPDVDAGAILQETPVVRDRVRRNVRPPAGTSLSRFVKLAVSFIQ